MESNCNDGVCTPTCAQCAAPITFGNTLCPQCKETVGEKLTKDEKPVIINIESENQPSGGG